MVGVIRGDEVEVRPGEFVGAVTVLMRRAWCGLEAGIDGIGVVTVLPQPIAGGIETLLPSETQ